MKYARIVNDAAIDVRTESPEGCFTPEVVTEFIEVPDEVHDGWQFVNGEWQSPPPPSPQPVPEKTISAEKVRASISLSERVKWDSGRPDEVATVKIEFSQPRNVDDATELLDFLVSVGVISQSSKNKALL